MKKKPFVLNVDMYRSYVVSLIGWDAKDAEDYIYKKMGQQPSFVGKDGCCAIMKNDSHDTVCIIYMKSLKMKPSHIALLSHECNHAALYILNGIGQDNISLTDHEHFTYLQQHILVNLLHNWVEK